MKIQATKLTQAQVAQKLNNGTVLVFVEYRSSKMEVIKYKDKVTQKEESFAKLVLNTEAGGVPLLLEGRLPRGYVGEVTVDLKKGQTILVCLTALRAERDRRMGEFMAEGETVYEMAEAK